MEQIDNASDRIKRIRYRLLDETPIISIERAKYYTEMWIETENQNISLLVSLVCIFISQPVLAHANMARLV